MSHLRFSKTSKSHCYMLGFRALPMPANNWNYLHSGICSLSYATSLATCVLFKPYKIKVQGRVEILVRNSGQSCPILPRVVESKFSNLEFCNLLRRQERSTFRRAAARGRPVVKRPLWLLSKPTCSLCFSIFQRLQAVLCHTLAPAPPGALLDIFTHALMDPLRPSLMFLHTPS